MSIPAVLPFGWSGSIEAPAWGNTSLDAVRAAELLESAISRKKPHSVVRKGATLEFRGGLFRLVWSWNILLGITRGLIQVQPNATGIRVSYRIHFTELLLYVTVAVALLAFVSLDSRPTTVPIDRHADFREDVRIFLFGWLWLFGGNVAITLVRFPVFLRRALGHN